MLDQFGLEVGPGYVGGNGDTVQSLSLANGGDGSGGWSDPGVQAQYAQTVADTNSIRELMAASSQPYLVTGTGSMADSARGDSVAYLPSMMEAYGIKPSEGVLNSYQDLVGQAYAPGSVISGYNPGTNAYSVGAGDGAQGADFMAQYVNGDYAAQPAQAQAGSQPQQPSQLGGLGQVAAGSQKPLPLPVAQSVSTPPTVQTDNAQPDDVIRSWFTANPGWTPEMLKNYMDSYGITPEQMARATANSPNIMVQRYNDTGKMPAQAGAQTQYVGYNQPLAPVAEGAGSGNLPYYYDTPTGKLSSYFKPSYWRGNAPAYGGMIRFAEGGQVKSPASSQEWLKAKCNG